MAPESFASTPQAHKFTEFFESRGRFFSNLFRPSSFPSFKFSPPTEEKLPITNASRPPLSPPSHRAMQFILAFIFKPLLAVGLCMFTAFFIMASMMSIMAFDAGPSVMAYCVVGGFAAADLALICITIKVLWHVMGYWAAQLFASGSQAHTSTEFFERTARFVSNTFRPFTFRSFKVSPPTESKLPITKASLPPPSPPSDRVMQDILAFIVEPLLAVGLCIFTPTFIMCSMMSFISFDSCCSEWGGDKWVTAFSIIGGFAAVDLTLLCITIKVLWHAFAYRVLAMLLIAGGVAWIVLA
eukprot:TRINITY_DN10410_c0_g1_i2.p1 TRINITY_DN10410_c0_g1~~TRINITY_DN10410_c0_g1_i2.p1  ORF type:complete len:298 (+),score=21.57 TRINITY_DN10410_c0_g1_i2:27-920(+)